MKRKSLPTGRDFLFVEGYGNENPGAFQSPRPLRGATCRGRRTTWRFCHFNPRAPCGARRDGAVVRLVQPRFQPTRPLRGATSLRSRRHTMQTISTHAPLAGRDGGVFSQHLGATGFQPTRPLRGATGGKTASCGELIFQPTRPLRGATAFQCRGDTRCDHFNPRAPCGARRLYYKPESGSTEFQPTRPLRGATGRG